MARPRLIGKYEDIGQRMADRAGLDLGPIGRRSTAATLVPIIEQLAKGSMSHRRLRPTRASAAPSPFGTAQSSIRTTANGTAGGVPALIGRAGSARGNQRYS